MSFPRSFKERMNSTLCCINGEAKNLITLYLGEYPQTRYELKGELEEIVKGSWIPAPQTIKEYLKCLVNYSVIEKNQNILTGAGKKYFQPIAAFALKFAVDNGFSLYSVFGKVDTYESCHGPYDRFRILEALKKGPQRTKDISEKLKTSSPNVGRQLKIIGESKVIDYESVSGVYGPGYSRYHWVRGTPKDVLPTGKRPLLVKRAAKIMYRLETFTRTDLARKLKYKDPGSLSRIIKEVREQGFVEPFKFMAQNIQSRAEFTSFGEKVFMKKFLDRISRALKDERSLEDMRKIQRKIGRDYAMLQEYATEGLNLYSKVAPGIKGWETRGRRKVSRVRL